MAQNITSVDVVEGMQNFVIRVNLKRVKELRLRTWIGRHLIVLAAWIMNCNLDILGDDDGEQPTAIA